VVQVVLFPDGTRATNISLYVRKPLN
jgi:hypothetical protein